MSNSAPIQKVGETGATRATARKLAASGVASPEKREATGATGLIPKPEYPAALRPGYAVYERKTITADGEYRAGVWLHGVKEVNGEQVPIDTWICTPLHVEAITSNDGGDFGRLLRFRNTLGDWREWAMPMHLLKGRGEELRGELLNMGVELDPDGHRALNRYLQSRHPDRRVTAATATGWHGSSLFIMPRQNIGTGDAIYQSEAATGDDFQQGGTLDGWRESIGSMCPGNPLLQLAIGSALAGPLLFHLQRQGGGFHIVGDSSTGKSTLIQAAASCWGNGEQFKRTWRATGNGLEGVAAQRNDALLVLDEIGEADPREVGNVVYALANGTGKARANRIGAARAAKRWRVMVLSSGELGLSALMAEGGKRAKTGQELRLLDIDGNRKHGCWDSLHQQGSGRHLSEAILRASVIHHGHAGPEFVRCLIDSGEVGKLPDALAAMVGHFHAESGQESRAAERFAMVALALELAATWELIPLPAGAAAGCMVELFNNWREQRGTGTGEDTAILKSLADFVDCHGGTSFELLNPGQSYQTRLSSQGRAGWRVTGEDGEPVWLFTSEGLKRAAPGYDSRRIADALVTAGWIVASDPGKRQKNTRTSEGPKRLYHVRIGEV